MALFQKISFDLKGRLIIFLIFICFTSGILIFVNYYSIKASAAVRAYIMGETLYSRGQKDAVRYLYQFLYSGNPDYISKYKKAIAVPKADRLARIALEDLQDDEEAKEQFLLGQNHPDDIDNLIWLFNHFGNLDFMTEVRDVWAEADSLVYELDGLASQVFEKAAADPLTEQEVIYYDNQIAELNALVTLKQYEFTQKLGATARKVEGYLFFFNLLVVLLIVLSIILIMYFILGKIHQQNRDLKVINHELDKFVYSASHDLRAPISSLKGLVAIAKKETDPQMFAKYFELMTKTLNRQDEFISDIILLSRNKRVGLELRILSPQQLIEEVIETHQFMEEAKSINFDLKVEVDNLIMDETRFRILLNNLISNAIKYHDPTKEYQFIKIELRRHLDSIIFKITDNGIGIRKEYQSRVFDMFFVTENKSKGSGLGLYMLSDVLQKIGGKVELRSEWGQGSSFTITWKDFKGE